MVDLDLGKLKMSFGDSLFDELTYGSLPDTVITRQSDRFPVTRQMNMIIKTKSTAGR